jgi:hypothetical protein
MRRHSAGSEQRRAAAVTRSAAALGSAEVSLADVVERMFALFESQLSLTTIVRVVRRCRRELDLSASPLVTEALERRARERLAVLAARL